VVARVVATATVTGVVGAVGGTATAVAPVATEVEVVVATEVPSVVAVEVALKLGPGTSTSIDLETLPGLPAGSMASTVRTVRAERARCRPGRVTASACAGERFTDADTCSLAASPAGVIVAVTRTPRSGDWPTSTTTTVTDTVLAGDRISTLPCRLNAGGSVAIESMAKWY
jgi:hypothetical protein